MSFSDGHDGCTVPIIAYLKITFPDERHFHCFTSTDIVKWADIIVHSQWASLFKNS